LTNEATAAAAKYSSETSRAYSPRMIAGSMMNVTEIQTEPAIIAMARDLLSE